VDIAFNIVDLVLSRWEKSFKEARWPSSRTVSSV
jgi:hypothetical protein